MNKERRRRALLRNIEMTRGALEHANELIRTKDKAAIAFPEKTEEFILEMKRKITEYQTELDCLEEKGPT